MEGISYQWYEVADNREEVAGTAIEGATEQSYTISYQKDTSKTYYYYCVATVSGVEGRSNTIEIKVTISENPSQEYTVTIMGENVTHTFSKTKYKAGETVSFTLAAKKGYEITSVKKDEEELNKGADGTYSFKMPGKDVTITVSTQKSTGDFDAIIQ